MESANGRDKFEAPMCVMLKCGGAVCNCQRGGTAANIKEYCSYEYQRFQKICISAIFPHKFSLSMCFTSPGTRETELLHILKNL